MTDDVPMAAAGTEVPARPAASLLVVRQDPDSLRILMARRGPGHRFMPNVLVFPGGAVDPGDFAAEAATKLREEVRVRLERSATAGLAHALAAAAARELTEEVGLSLGMPPALHGLDFFTRAVTPPDRAMRFDAYFFTVDSSFVTGELCGSTELEAPGWYTMAEALAGELAGATKAVLWQFNRWREQPVHTGPVPVLRERVWVHE